MKRVPAACQVLAAVRVDVVAYVVADKDAALRVVVVVSCVHQNFCSRKGVLEPKALTVFWTEVFAD